MLSTIIIAAVQRRTRQRAAVVHRELRRGLTSLATIISLAPFLGLLGTVVGIIESFVGCGGERWTCFAAFVERLSHAIYPAAFGLLIAVPGLWAYRYFQSEVEAFDIEMANATLDLINCLSRRSR